MRIIAGTARSMPLRSLPGTSIRPTQDRTKETLFNILAPMIPGCRFLDLFAGTGAIAVEALSRGASRAVLVEKNTDALRVIRENLTFTRLADRAEVRRGDVLRVLPSMEGSRFDVIFLDPPFGQGLVEETVRLLGRVPGILSRGGLVVAEAPLDEDLSFLQDTAFRMTRYKPYKTHAHVFLTPREDER